MHLRLERAASELPADCEAVFRNSAIFERYFQDPGRLELSLRRAAAQGELYLAVSEDGELAGARRVTLMVSDFNQGAQAFYRSRGYWLLGSLPDAVKPGIGELVMVKDLQ